METATALESARDVIERRFYANLLVTYGGYSKEEASSASLIPYDRVPSSIRVDMLRAKYAYEDAVEQDSSKENLYSRILNNCHELRLNEVPIVRHLSGDRLSDPVYNLLTRAKNSIEDLLKDTIEQRRNSGDLSGPEDIDVYVGTKQLVLENLIGSMDGIPVDLKDHGSVRYKMTERKYTQFNKMSNTINPLESLKSWLVNDTEDTWYEF